MPLSVKIAVIKLQCCKGSHIVRWSYKQSHLASTEPVVCQKMIKPLPLFGLAIEISLPANAEKTSAEPQRLVIDHSERDEFRAAAFPRSVLIA